MYALVPLPLLPLVLVPEPWPFAVVVELPYVWDPNDRNWEETDYTGNFLPPRPEKEDAELIEAERRARFENP